MLVKPDLQEESIADCLHHHYGVHLLEIDFLPLGADQNAAVYRALADNGATYFVKLKRGAFDEICVALPTFLHNQGIESIIAPLATRHGQHWTTLDEFSVIVYPFVEGSNGYEIGLSARHWVELGATLRRIHDTRLPDALRRRIPPERYSAYWRESVRAFLARAAQESFDDPIARATAHLLRVEHELIADLVRRAERLAQALQARPQAFTVCHSDLHAGNILISARQDRPLARKISAHNRTTHETNVDALYIVDWDNPLLALKERDLMYAGASLMGAGHSAAEEEALFYQGYGETQVDPSALAYYRYERIVQDIAEFGQQLLPTQEVGAAGVMAPLRDREQSLRYLQSNFLPNNTIATAYASDRT